MSWRIKISSLTSPDTVEWAGAWRYGSLKHLVPGEVPKRGASKSLSKELCFLWLPALWVHN